MTYEDSIHQLNTGWTWRVVDKDKIDLFPP